MGFKPLTDADIFGAKVSEKFSIPGEKGKYTVTVKGMAPDDSPAALAETLESKGADGVSVTRKLDDVGDIKGRSRSDKVTVNVGKLVSAVSYYGAVQPQQSGDAPPAKPRKRGKRSKATVGRGSLNGTTTTGATV